MLRQASNSLYLQPRGATFIFSLMIQLLYENFSLFATQVVSLTKEFLFQVELPQQLAIFVNFYLIKSSMLYYCSYISQQIIIKTQDNLHKLIKIIFNLSHSKEILSFSQESLQNQIIIMATLQSLNKYHSFTEKIVDQLIIIGNKKISISLSYSYSLDSVLKDIRNNIASINEFEQQNKEYSSFLTIYTDLLRESRALIEREKQMVNMKMLILQSIYLPILQSCKSSWFENQQKVLSFAQTRLSEINKSTNQVAANVGEQLNQIKRWKIQTFIKTISVLNELDRTKIKQSQLFTDNQKRRDFFDDKINFIQQNFNKTEEMIAHIDEQCQSLPLLQIQRKQFLVKILQKVTQINLSKTQQIEKLCRQISPVYHRQLLPPLNLQPINEQGQRFSSNCVKNIPKYYIKILQLISCTSKRSKIVEIQEIQEIHQGVDNHDHDEQDFDYDLSIIRQSFISSEYFLKCLRCAAVQPFSTQFQERNFLSFFERSIKSKQLQQTFIFYLYQLQNKQPLTQVLSQSTITSMLKIVLNQSQIQYQKVIKIIILVCMLQNKNQNQIMAQIRSHEIWSKIQFWQIAFLENIYQFLQQLSLKSSSLDAYYDSFWIASEGSSNWLSSIFRSRSQMQEQKKINQQKALNQYNRQYFESISIAYLSIMQILHVSTDIKESFKNMILLAVQQLKWPSQIAKQLSDSFKKIQIKEQQRLRTMLTDRNILSYMVNHRLKNKQGDKMSVYRLIKKWLNRN